MFTLPFPLPAPPTQVQLETVWHDFLADVLTITRYNLGRPSLREILEQNAREGQVFVTIADDWTIVNWLHDKVPLPDVPGKFAGWSGGWVSQAGRGPVLAGARRLVHEALVNRCYRSIGVVVHGAAVVAGNLAGERHTRNIGYSPIGVAPEFARVKRTPAVRDEDGVLTAHTIWCWGEDNARFVWELAMQRTQGLHVAFEDREMITEIHLG